MSDSRAAILGRLRAAGAAGALPEQDFSIVDGHGWPVEEKLARLRRAMEAAHAEFLDVSGEDWVGAVCRWMAEAQLPSLIFGADTPHGRRLISDWPKNGPQLIPYARPMEEWKEEFFAASGAGITSTEGAIAATGSLILKPGVAEPRTLSLVPPVHIALLETGRLYDTMRQAMQEQSWASAMPTNLLLISGPSKTSDIEQTLAYGVHGPTRLLVVLAEKF